MRALIRPEDCLKEFYERNGCLRVRVDDPEKGRHGGVELRLVVSDTAERRDVRAALKALKIPHGTIYRKQKTRKQWVIPLYARADILDFLKAARPKGYTVLIRKIKSTAKRRPIKVRRNKKKC